MNQSSVLDKRVILGLYKNFNEYGAKISSQKVLYFNVNFFSVLTCIEIA